MGGGVESANSRGAKVWFVGVFYRKFGNPRWRFAFERAGSRPLLEQGFPKHQCYAFSKINVALSSLKRKAGRSFTRVLVLNLKRFNEG